MISLQDSGESGDEVQDDIAETIYLVTCTVLVDTTLHTGLLGYTFYRWNFYNDQWINITQGLCY